MAPDAGMILLRTRGVNARPGSIPFRLGMLEVGIVQYPGVGVRFRTQADPTQVPPNFDAIPLGACWLRRAR